LVTIKDPQVVDRRRYVRQTVLRLFLRELTVDFQRFLEFLPSLRRPVLVAIQSPQIVERRRYVR
jgi:hypothetical protein